MGQLYIFYNILFICSRPRDALFQSVLISTLILSQIQNSVWRKAPR